MISKSFNNTQTCNAGNIFAGLVFIQIQNTLKTIRDKRIASVITFSSNSALDILLSIKNRNEQIINTQALNNNLNNVFKQLPNWDSMLSELNSHIYNTIYNNINKIQYNQARVNIDLVTMFNIFMKHMPQVYQNNVDARTFKIHFICGYLSSIWHIRRLYEQKWKEQVSSYLKNDIIVDKTVISPIVKSFASSELPSGIYFNATGIIRDNNIFGENSIYIYQKYTSTNNVGQPANRVKAKDVKVKTENSNNSLMVKRNGDNLCIALPGCSKSDIKVFSHYEEETPYLEILINRNMDFFKIGKYIVNIPVGYIIKEQPKVINGVMTCVLVTAKPPVVRLI